MSDLIEDQIAGWLNVPTNDAAFDYGHTDNLLADAEVELRRLRGQVVSQAKALAFAASCIKSGERWSDECEKIIIGALRDE